MKTYHVYYLPHVVRDTLPGVIGKVGYSSNSPQKRKTDNAALGYDVTDHTVLHDGIETLEDAIRIEHGYQLIYNCLDGTRSPYYKKTFESVFKGKPRAKMPPCPHCGKIVDAGNYKLWHGDKCKEKK